jgi:formamidopyrimidine-DNA glycosylase
MFEIPEFVTLARQINDALPGKAVLAGLLGNKPHKFVWYNQTHADFARLAGGKTIGTAWTRGRWLFIPLEPGYLLVFGECGGKMLYHPPTQKPPETYHLYLAFEDGSAFTETTQMWGAMELYERGQEQERQYIKGMRPTPVEPEFTFAYFDNLIDNLLTGKKRSLKGLLTQDQLIPGLGNAIAQDILYRARLHPRRPLNDLAPNQRRDLYDSIQSIVAEAIQKGGRYDEFDLYNQPGQYIRLMDKQSVGRHCTVCGAAIEKIQYLGGSCYFCPICQQ